jgi:hypothetical protein
LLKVATDVKLTAHIYLRKWSCKFVFQPQETLPELLRNFPLVSSFFSILNALQFIEYGLFWGQESRMRSSSINGHIACGFPQRLKSRVIPATVSRSARGRTAPRQSVTIEHDSFHTIPWMFKCRRWACIDNPEMPGRSHNPWYKDLPSTKYSNWSHPNSPNDAPKKINTYRRRYFGQCQSQE